MQDLKSLCQYYLRCIDAEKSNFYEIYSFSKHFQLIDNKALIERAIDGDSKALCNYVQSISNTFEVQKEYTICVGYPLLLIKSLNKYIPVFVFTLEEDNSVGRIPMLNAAIVKFFFNKKEKQDSESSIYDLINLQNQIGFDEDGFDFKCILNKLKEETPLWNWCELQTSINEDERINSQAIVFCKEKEKNKYTLGLEKELAKLMNLEPSQYNKTALYKWLNNDFISQKHEIKFYEVFASNEEQSRAVAKALSSGLSVISGPPGTGKSQVVSNILVNAIINNMSVLFSSKNHKAVDVVVDRVNSLSKYPAVIKFGGWKDSYTRISEYVEKLLSKEVKQEDKNLYDNLENRYNELSLKIQEINKKCEEIINFRNKLDDYEKNISQVDESVRKRVLNCEQNDIKLDIQTLKNIDHVKTILDFKSQSFFTKMFWKRILCKRMDKTIGDIKKCEIIIKKYTPIYDSRVEDNNDILDAIDAIALNSEKLIKDINTCLKYRILLEKLIKIGNLPEYHKKLSKICKKLSTCTQQFWIARQKVLPTTWTNSDRDRMAELLSMLRISSQGDMDWKIAKRIEEYLKRSFSCWAVTSLSMSSSINFLPAIYDIVVVDEASQCDIASFLPLLYRAKSVVVIGDNKQLRHISEISTQKDKELLRQYNVDYKWSYSINSMYDVALGLCPQGKYTKLLEHHRSHSDIIEYSNKEFYGGELRIATKYEVLNPINHNDLGVHFINVAGKCTTPQGGSLINEYEANETVEYVRNIDSNGYSGSIGVVTPFRAQADYINETLAKDHDLFIKLRAKGFLCDTVHRFQGDEKDIIIFSTVLSKNAPDSAINFIKSTANLFNVAITRARAELIVIGDRKQLFTSNIPHIVHFVEYVNNLENKAEIKNEICKSVSEFQSDWELVLSEALTNAGIDIIPQYSVDKYVLDIAIIKNNCKLDIEIDGELYHKEWNGEILRKDQMRNFRLQELGWEVKRFWVYQVRDMLSSCVADVKNWYNAN